MNFDKNGILTTWPDKHWKSLDSARWKCVFYLIGFMSHRSLLVAHWLSVPEDSKSNSSGSENVPLSFLICSLKIASYLRFNSWLVKVIDSRIKRPKLLIFHFCLKNLQNHVQMCKNMVKGYFDQRLECATPKHWPDIHQSPRSNFNSSFSNIFWLNLCELF